MSNLKRIISGGQTGADQGGLIAGRTLDIETGGFAPFGWTTEVGAQKELLVGFGLREWYKLGYAARTKANVQMADATVIFVTQPSSPGSQLTMQCCLKLKKKVMVFDWRKLASAVNKLRFKEWMAEVVVLNVAGSRESKAPGIQVAVADFLVEVL